MRCGWRTSGCVGGDGRAAAAGGRADRRAAAERTCEDMRPTQCSSCRDKLQQSSVVRQGCVSGGRACRRTVHPQPWVLCQTSLPTSLSVTGLHILRHGDVVSDHAPPPHAPSPGHRSQENEVTLPARGRTDGRRHAACERKDGSAWTRGRGASVLAHRTPSRRRCQGSRLPWMPNPEKILAVSTKALVHGMSRRPANRTSGRLLRMAKRLMASLSGADHAKLPSITELLSPSICDVMLFYFYQINRPNYEVDRMGCCAPKLPSIEG